MDSTTAEAAQARSDSSLVTAGYVFSLLIPIIGFFIGLALMIRGKANHGIACMVISVVTVIVIVSVIGAMAAEELETYGECLDRAQSLAAMEACE